MENGKIQQQGGNKVEYSKPVVYTGQIYPWKYMSMGSFKGTDY